MSDIFGFVFLFVLLSFLCSCFIRCPQRLRRTVVLGGRKVDGLCWLFRWTEVVVRVESGYLATLCSATQRSLARSYVMKVSSFDWQINLPRPARCPSDSHAFRSGISSAYGQIDLSPHVTLIIFHPLTTGSHSLIGYVVMRLVSNCNG